MTPEQALEWQACGKSIRGASHIRDQQPNQDAITWSLGPDQGLPLVMAVSDGHGSKRSFRSDLGSAFAVDTLSRILSEFASHPDTGISQIEKEARRILPRELEYGWKRHVLDHMVQHPFTERETETLYVYREEPYGNVTMLNPFLAYGATALGVLVTQRYQLFMQLGDGDMMAVQDNGKVSRPLPEDPRLLGNSTTSLCTSNAARDVRLAIYENNADMPGLILVSTDGYSNSFKNDTEFLRVGTDIMSFICSDGLEKVGHHLTEWLEETSRMGSGDDITLGIISRQESQTDSAPMPEQALSRNTP